MSKYFSTRGEIGCSFDLEPSGGSLDDAWKEKLSLGEVARIIGICKLSIPLSNTTTEIRGLFILIRHINQRK